MLTLSTLHHLIDLRARARAALTLDDQLALGQHAAEQIGQHVDELLVLADGLLRLRGQREYPDPGWTAQDWQQFVARVLREADDELDARQAPAATGGER